MLNCANFNYFVNYLKLTAILFLRFGSHDYLNCTAVEVPFRGGLISLLALLPRDPAGMRLLETRLSAQRLTDILNAMHVDTVDFQVRLFNCYGFCIRKLKTYSKHRHALQRELTNHRKSIYQQA